MESIFLNTFFWFLYLTFILIGCYLFLKKKDKLEYLFFPLLVYFGILLYYFFFGTFKNITEYNSFNELTAADVDNIFVNREKVNAEKISAFFEELKIDHFILLNHPSVIKTDSIKVVARNREYNFIVQNTSNQGVLIKRISSNGKIYATNKNNRLLQYLKYY